MRKWSSISMPRSWMEGNSTTVVLEFRAILGVPGLRKGPKGGTEISVTFQGKAPNSPRKGQIIEWCPLKSTSDSQGSQINGVCHHIRIFPSINFCPKCKIGTPNLILATQISVEAVVAQSLNISCVNLLRQRLPLENVTWSTNLRGLGKAF